MRDSAGHAQDAICDFVEKAALDPEITLDQVQQLSAVFANVVWGPDGGDYVQETQQRTAQRVERIGIDESRTTVEYDYHTTHHDGEDRDKPKVGYG